MNKRVNYIELLKESIADRGHDTTTTVDMKGPFLDPILGYDGGGELPTHKDAASILERYYFKEKSDTGVRVTEDAEIPQVGKDKAALPDETIDVDDAKDEIKDAVEMKESDVVENAVLERLIAEMEEDDEPDQDPAAKFHEPSGDPDKDSSGLIDGDDHDGGEDVVKAATFPAGSEIGKGIKEDLDIFNELLEAEEAEKEITPGGEETPDDKEEEEEEEEDLDVDKELKESGAPIDNPKTANEDIDEDSDDEDLEEAFNIFREAIEDEEEDDEDEEEDDEDEEDDDEDELEEKDIVV